MKKCAACGTDNEDKDKFCTQCAGKFPEQQSPPQPDPPQQNPPQQNPPQPDPPQPDPPQPDPPQQNPPQPDPPQPDPHSGITQKELGGALSKLVFNDNSEIYFEEHQKVIGRSELSDTAKSLGADPLEISRQHFTIYSAPNQSSQLYANPTTCYIVDGTTSVQEKPSSNHTKVNGNDITGHSAIELHDGDEIQVATTLKAVFHVPSQFISASKSDGSTDGTGTSNNKMTDNEVKNKYDNMPDM